MSKSKIQIIDDEGFVLREFESDQVDQAYQYAELMESMDIDVSIKTPSVTRTLAESLGAERKELAQLEQELNDEIEDHIPNSKCGLCQ